MTAEKDMLPDAAAPQVSIIVPVYNSEPYLSRCLASIQAQTFAGWECICVDDGSTDGSGAILDEYAERDARFVVVHKENGGTSSARNAGLKVARGEYIGFVDHDDWIESETYEAALEAARRTSADIVQWGYKTERKGKSERSKELPEGLFSIRENPECFEQPVWCKLFRSGLARRHTFPTEAKMGFEDACFSIATYADAQKSFCLGRALYHHDLTHESLSSRKKTADAVTATAKAIKEACGYAAKIAGIDGGRTAQNRNVSIILFRMKADAKKWALLALPQPDFSLFRAVFPELNKQMLRYFLKEKSLRSLVMLLAAWRLDGAARTILKIRRWIQSLPALM